jgi:hypothetical protein
MMTPKRLLELAKAGLNLKIGHEMTDEVWLDMVAVVEEYQKQNRTFYPDSETGTFSGTPTLHLIGL